MKYFWNLILLIFLTSIAISQTPKGKIAGKVVDKSTGEPLPGANVLIEGTTMGAACNFDGEYFIINVPPGRYNLVASMVGYRKMVVKDVLVYVDRTTTVNFQLEPTVIEVEPVVVEARRPVIEKDKTSTSVNIESREIESAPIEGLKQILELTAGIIQNPNGTYSVRGGGAYELNFMINGVEQITTNTGVPGYSFAWDKSNNSWKYDYNPLAVAQMEIISGGFSAEYGNAQSGVVKVVTKEGGPKLSGEFRFEYRPPGQYHWGHYLYGPENVEWKKWGTLEAWKKTYPDSSDEWLYKMWKKWVENHSPTPDGGAIPLGVYDYRKLSYKRFLLGFGGPLGSSPEALRFFISAEYRAKPTRIPTIERVQIYQNYTLTLSWNPVPGHKFKLMGMYQYYRGGLFSGSDDIRWAGRDGSWKYVLVTDSPRDEITTTQSFTWTYAINPKSFFELTAYHSRERYIVLVLPVPQRPSYLRDDVWSIPPGPWDEGYRTVYSFTTLYGQDARTDAWSIYGDYTNQITPRLQIKAGFKFNYWDTYYNAVSSFAANAFISRTGYAEYYKAYPFYIAGYAQSRFEYEGMVANVGVRLDGYNFNTEIPYDRFNPFYPALGAEAIGDPRTKKTRGYVRISPRFGLSFPIGENTAFRLQYGHFYSMPTFKEALMKTTELGWIAYGNGNLGPKQTISYEFGIQHSYKGTHRVDVVAYYNDRVKQVGTLYIYAPSAGIRRNKRYVTYENNSYGASKGIEITVDKVAPGRWGYRLTYSLSRTTFGYYGPRSLWSDDPNDPRNYQERNQANDFLSYDDRTHTFRALVSYNVEKGGGIEIFGIKPFSDFTISITYTAQSGTPFTYVTSYDEFKDVVNNRRYPLEAKADLNITKRVYVGKQSILLGIRVMNLFNNRWLTPFSSQDDLRDWVERNITPDMLKPGEDPLNPRASYKFNYFTTYRNVPREIYFTVGLGF